MDGLDVSLVMNGLDVSRVMNRLNVSSLVNNWLNVSSLVNDWSVDSALVVALEVMVLWGVRCEGLVVGLAVIWSAVIAVLVPFDRLVVHWHLVGRDVILLSVVYRHGMMSSVPVVIVIFSVMRLIVVELFLVKGYGVLNMVDGHMLSGVDGNEFFPMISMLVASVVTVVGNSLIWALVTAVVGSAVGLALSVLSGGGSNSGNSSEGKRSHCMCE